ncbi:MAG: septation protein A [Thiomicrospira sp.]|uniref:septation protein A n=1 Tax=Thiomicrospira sp. TaxID=935 RepID=UPI0019EB8BDB|nr:septation protein A [Thiomicrospira sp.]MBE0493903.1 septation protein A [Thiomicrospira sp.]
MKLLFDLFPVFLFFIAYKMYDIYIATGVIIVATIIQVSYLYARHRRVEKIHLITLGLIVILGGATLLLQDERFIAWKPTIVNWGFALVFLASHYVMGNKPIVRRMMEAMIELPDQIWVRLSYLWVGFFVFSGLINLWVYYNFSLDAWVNFKLFGLMGLTFAFILLQGLYISRYTQISNDEEVQSTESSNETGDSNRTKPD